MDGRSDNGDSPRAKYFRKSLTPTESKMEYENNNNNNDYDDEKMEDEDCNDANPNILWSLDEPTDTLFCAHGLINHSGVKSKTVFVTWNENYLINFVFKTSQKTRQTTLTKVRLIMPTYKCLQGNDDKQIDDVQEEIKHITILEYNTLLLMHSGHVYYFSSVKTLQLIDWLSDVRCISSNSMSSSSSYPNTFSLIRFKLNALECEARMKKQLCVEVYSDYVNFGKSIAGENSPIFSYDITFDECNFFECHWEDDQYTVLNLYVTKENIQFFNLLANMGTNFVNANANSIVLMENQNIQIFTISGNLFILIGDHLKERINQNQEQHEHQDPNYQIQLLNCYTSNIECVYYEYDKQLLIVLLQCGYIDVWYKSRKSCDALLHKNIQISSYLHYTYCANDTTFYFITNDQIIQLKISYNSISDANNDIAPKTIVRDECIMNTRYKCIGGMMACTWVQHLKQLICLSCNNIFYRLTFEHKNCSDCSTEQYENVKQLYALTEGLIKELLQRSNLLKELRQKPKLLHQQIEKEYQKQIIIAMSNKSKILCKKFQARFEYRYHLPKAHHFHESTLLRQFNWFTEGGGGGGEVGHRTFYHILIYLKLLQPISNSILEAFTTKCWYLHLCDKEEASAKGHSIWLNLPGHVLLNAQELCLIATVTTNGLNLNLREPHLKATTFLQHNSQFLCISFDINVRKDQRTYNGLFTSKMYYMPENPIKNDLNGVLQQFNRDINIHQKINNFNYVFPVDNSKMFMDIVQSLSFHKNDLLVLENDVAKIINLYFLGYYLITLNYKVSQRQFTLTSSYPHVLFYMKLHCMYMAQHLKDVMVCSNGQDNSRKLLSYIVKMQCDIQRSHGGFKSLPDQITSNDIATSPNDNNSSLHLENLRRIYNKLRTEFSEVYT